MLTDANISVLPICDILADISYRLIPICQPWECLKKYSSKIGGLPTRLLRKNAFLLHRTHLAYIFIVHMSGHLINLKIPIKLFKGKFTTGHIKLRMLFSL